ncbi:MAG: cytochrome c [Marinoscillum sp.]
MKVLKILGIVVVCLIVLVAAGIGYVKTALPDVGEPSDLTVEITPELVERGAYLANSVTVCMDCHSQRDWSRFSGPLVAGSFGKGGEVFNEDFDFPGVFTAKNITPAGISHWTDGELYRLITTGVTKEGKAIFPVMPYGSYGRMAHEDVISIIAYVRSLDPIENEVGESAANFPMNIILNTIPQPANPQPKPDPSDQIAYGAYMVTAAACADCHTPQDQGTPIEGKYLAGGFEFKMPGFGIVRSSNITPDVQTGIGAWTEEVFVNRFKSYADSTYVPHQVGAGEMQTVMPWTMYGTMKENDLKAIYAYLSSLEPNNNKITKFEPVASL